MATWHGPVETAEDRKPWDAKGFDAKFASTGLLARPVHCFAALHGRDDFSRWSTKQRASTGMKTELLRRSLRQCWLALGYASILSLQVGRADAEGSTREWFDSTGKFRVKATMIDLENGRVRLLSTTGKVIRVPLSRLSADDRRYVAVEFRRIYLARQGQSAEADQGRNDRQAAVPNSSPTIRMRPLWWIAGFNPTVPKDATPLTKKREYQPMLQHLSESDLSSQLADETPELDLYHTNQAARTLIASLDQTSASRTDRTRSRKSRQSPPKYLAIREQMLNRPDFQGLPMRMGAECKLSEGAARPLQEISFSLGRKRSQLEQFLPTVTRQVSSVRIDPDGAETRWQDQRKSNSRDDRLVSFLRGTPGFDKAHAVAALVQMLQAETPVVRRQLIESLDRIDGQRASTALARRAVFDLSAENRAAATEALKKRPAIEYREELIDAFRYPWLPAAQHAAEALVRLNDQAAVDDLVVLLEEPNPCAPYQPARGKPVHRELVKVNHLRNCLLCHAGSTDRRDWVRGRIPYPDEPLPSDYYESASGSFVRADITYLRQDFSVTQPVVDHGPWPPNQRFDYLIRTRSLSPEELADEEGRDQDPENPHRDAVVFALRKLIGEGRADEN